MSMGSLNLGSLIFGLIAWILPFVYIIRINESKIRNGLVFSLASISACLVSLCMQIFYTNYLVKIGDWSAISDIFPSVTLVSALLVTIAIILNGIALIIYHKKL